MRIPYPRMRAPAGPNANDVDGPLTCTDIAVVGAAGPGPAPGVRFDAHRLGRLARGLEGGHSVRRVAHAGGSATGRRVVRQLSAIAAEEPRITVLEDARAQA